MEATLIDLGMAASGQTWGMVLPLKDLKLSRNTVEGLDITRVTNKRSIIDFATLVSTASKPPNAHLKLYVGYAGGKPVAAAEIY